MMPVHTAHAATSKARALPPRRPSVVRPSVAPTATQRCRGLRPLGAGRDGHARLGVAAQHRYFECRYGRIGADLAMDFIARINALPSQELCALPKELQGRPVIYVQPHGYSRPTSRQILPVLDAVNAGQYGWRLSIIEDSCRTGTVIGFCACL